jgi:hypothetical protein
LIDHIDIYIDQIGKNDEKVRSLCIDSDSKIISEHHFELVSRDMLYLALLSKFPRTKNHNSRISNVGCKKILFELPYAKKIETLTTLGFLRSAFKKCLYIGSGDLAKLFFVLTGVLTGTRQRNRVKMNFVFLHAYCTIYA